MLCIRCWCSGLGSVRYSAFIRCCTCSISFVCILPICGHAANLLLRKVMFSLASVLFLVADGPLKTISRKDSKLFRRVFSLNSCSMVARYFCNMSSTSVILMGMCVWTYDKPDTNWPMFSNRGSTVEALELGVRNSRVVRNKIVNCGWWSLIRYLPSCRCLAIPTRTLSRGPLPSK